MENEQWVNCWKWEWEPVVQSYVISSISSIFYLIMLYVIYCWLVYCLFYFSKTVLVGLNLCCFQMLFFPPTQEKEDHSLTKHLYYSQLFLWIFFVK